MSPPRHGSSRRQEGLADRLDGIKRLAATGVRLQRRILAEDDEIGMRLAGEAQGAGERNVGVADPLAEPPVAAPFGPLPLQGREAARDLATTAPGPNLGDRGVQPQLLEQAPPPSRPARSPAPRGAVRDVAPALPWEQGSAGTKPSR